MLSGATVGVFGLFSAARTRDVAETVRIDVHLFFSSTYVLFWRTLCPGNIPQNMTVIVILVGFWSKEDGPKQRRVF